jgi:hypothetical protein
VVKEAVPIFKQIQTNISKHKKGIAQAAKNAEKARKEQERATKRATEVAEKARKKAEREEAATARKAACGRGRVGQRGCHAAGRGTGRGWGQGRGAIDVDSEGDSEREHFDVSSSAESDGDNDPSRSSDAATSGGQGQHGDIYEEEAVDGPHLPAPLTKQNVQPRPCPRPTYRMPEAVDDVANEVEQHEGFYGPQLWIGEAPIEDEVRGEAKNVAEGENVAETARWYPRRSNWSNLHFTYGIDA